MNASISDFKKNLMGTTAFALQIPGMRKPQGFSVYPISAGAANPNLIKIQSDKRFGLFDLEKNIGKMSESHSNGAYSYHLATDKLTTFSLSDADLATLKSHIFKTASAHAGTSGIAFCDNSAAALIRL